jgi:hypothetical protein
MQRRSRRGPRAMHYRTSPSVLLSGASTSQRNRTASVLLRRPPSGTTVNVPPRSARRSWCLPRGPMRPSTRFQSASRLPPPPPPSMSPAAHHPTSVPHSRDKWGGLSSLPSSMASHGTGGATFPNPPSGARQQLNRSAHVPRPAPPRHPNPRNLRARRRPESNQPNRPQVIIKHAIHPAIGSPTRTGRHPAQAPEPRQSSLRRPRRAGGSLVEARVPHANERRGPRHLPPPREQEGPPLAAQKAAAAAGSPAGHQGHRSANPCGKTTCGREDDCVVHGVECHLLSSCRR